TPPVEDAALSALSLDELAPCNFLRCADLRLARVGENEQIEHGLLRLRLERGPDDIEAGKHPVGVFVVNGHADGRAARQRMTINFIRMYDRPVATFQADHEAD